MARDVVLTDIEGTTSSIAFVRDVLFPYARAELPGYVRAHRGEREVEACLADAAREAGVDPGDTEAVVAALLRWIDEDRKLTPLKTLQGLLWKRGYAERAYVAHMYPDAVAKLREWRARGHRQYVYSSGSIAAQKLYFAHTEAGDLTPLFDGYFDTTSGGKREAASYANIAGTLDADPARIVFLSDIEAELDAAAAAGLRTVHVVRDGGAGSARHRVVRSFEEVELG